MIDNELSTLPGFSGMEDNGEVLLRLSQLPVIEQTLWKVKDKVEILTNEAMAVVCTPDTLASVRAVRADLNRQFNALETQRKALKQALVAPYEAFEKDVYRRCVTEPFRRADANLKAKIEDSERTIKQECEEILRTYFNELCAVNNLSFLSFGQTGVKVDLSVAKKKDNRKEKEQISAFVDRVKADISAIYDGFDAEFAAEIFAEYKRTLDLTNSIATVTERRRVIAAAHEEAERMAAHIASEEAATIKSTTAAAEAERAAPIDIPELHQDNAKDAALIFRCTFTVRGTKKQLKRLKEFMYQEGIEIEQQ